MEYLCNDFMVGKSALSPNKCGGQVVLARAFVYLAIRVKSDLSSVGAMGLVGGLVAWAADKATGSKQISCVKFQTLPEEVKTDPVWTKIGDEHDVIVLPKEALTELTFSWLSGIKIATKEQVFHLCISPFGLSGAKRKFRALGWEV